MYKSIKLRVKFDLVSHPLRAAGLVYIYIYIYVCVCVCVCVHKIFLAISCSKKKFFGIYGQLATVFGYLID